MVIATVAGFLRGGHRLAGLPKGVAAWSGADGCAAGAAGGGAVQVHHEERQRAGHEAAAAPGPSAALGLTFVELTFVDLAGTIACPSSLYL